MKPSSLHVLGYSCMEVWRDDDEDASGRLMDLDEIARMEVPAPKPRRPAHRPPPDEATLERRRLAAWLVESGTLPRAKVELLLGVKRRALYYWQAAHRRRSA